MGLAVAVLQLAAVVTGAPLRNKPPPGHADPYAHHKVKEYYQQWHDKSFSLVETSVSAGTSIFRDTSHCADPYRNGAQEMEMKRRYDPRANEMASTSKPSLEGTLRSRCVPKLSTEGNTAFTDQCLVADPSCKDLSKCRVVVLDCPSRGESTQERPRWSLLWPQLQGGWAAS